MERPKAAASASGSGPEKEREEALPDLGEAAPQVLEEGQRDIGAPIVGELTEEEQNETVDRIVADLRQQYAARGTPLKEPRKPATPEEAEMQRQKAIRFMAGEGVDASKMKINVIELEQQPMKDDPEAKYTTDKATALAAYERGDIQVMEAACDALLARKPDDTEVWRLLTTSRLRLHWWDVALESAKRWIGHDPYAVVPRSAEAVALAGCERYGEARARFHQLAIEVEAMSPDMAAELNDCTRRVDELWMDKEPGVAKLSIRPAQILMGQRAPHFYLPNFAESVGPVKVLYADSEEPGGGQNHSRKVVVTKDVSAGELLFVQGPVVFGLVEKEEQFERLSDALVNAATTSPRAAALLEMLADDGELAEDNQVVETVAEKQITRPTWSKEPKAMSQHLDTCQKVLQRSRLYTGRSYTGVWALPGLSRHSCVPTANYVCFGDTLVARAAVDLKEGEEVTFPFFDILAPLEIRRQIATDKLNFWCKCPRCQAEDGFGPKALQACEKLKTRFQRSASRTTAIKEQLQIKMDLKDQERRRKFNSLSKEEAKKYNEGLVGLADKFKDLNGKRLTDEDLAELREYLPERNEPDLVKVPPDLADDLFGAVVEFEEEIAESGIPELHQRWAIVSHLCYYGEALVLMRLLKDMPAQRRLVSRMLPALKATMPGSFAHMRLSVFNWEVAAQCEDPTLSQAAPGHDLARAEKELCLENLRLRYGNDLSLIELEAAMARVACTRDIDENWCWVVSWCIGQTPQEPLSPDESKLEIGKIASAPTVKW